MSIFLLFDQIMTKIGQNINANISVKISPNDKKKWISKSKQKGQLKDVQDGISRPQGSQELQKTKVCTVLLDTLHDIVMTWNMILSKRSNFEQLKIGTVQNYNKAKKVLNISVKFFGPFLDQMNQKKHKVYKNYQKNATFDFHILVAWNSILPTRTPF